MNRAVFLSRTMNEPAESPLTLGRQRATVRRSKVSWYLVGATIVLSAIGLRPTFRMLWEFWTTDPLQSIGLLLLPIAIVLIVLEWRGQRWSLDGTWWGFPLIALAFVMSMLHDDVALYWTTGNGSSIALLSISLPLFLLAAGLLLLFAGSRVCAAAALPLFLLLMAKPVPVLFSQMLDLPLQHVTAQVARSFATAIGFAPKTPELLLMFSPDFGMFIAPGCDGIRGAITMGYLALIVGYIKRLSWILWACYVVSAVLLGYVFNFTRICLLVLYYRIALGHQHLEDLAKQADYAIGLCLFITGTLFFAKLMLRKGKSRPSYKSIVPEKISSANVPSVELKCIAVLLVLAVTVGVYARASSHSATPVGIPFMQGKLMPQRIGLYQLQKTLIETDMGTLRTEDGLYESSVTHQQVTLIVWLGHAAHNVHDSWYARGLSSEFRTVETFNSANGPIVFDRGLYLDGYHDSLLMNAMCTPSNCSSSHQANNRMGLIFTAPDLVGLASGRGRIVAMALKIEEPHAADSDSEINARLTGVARDFVQALNGPDISGRFQ